MKPGPTRASAKRTIKGRWLKVRPLLSAVCVLFAAYQLLHATMLQVAEIKSIRSSTWSTANSSSSSVTFAPPLALALSPPQVQTTTPPSPSPPPSSPSPSPSTTEYISNLTPEFPLSLMKQIEYKRNKEAFVKFATENGCDVNHPVYDMIDSTLQPYLATGITDDMIDKGYRKCRDTLLIEIRNKEIVKFKLKPGSSREGKARIGWFVGFFGALAGYLPNTILVVNLMDEPCSWINNIPKEDEDAYNEGKMSFERAFLKHGCDALGMQYLKDLHGFFVSPETFPATRELVPVWSPYSIPGCFGDLLGPYNGATLKNANCPDTRMRTKPFKHKKKVAIFRGSTSGGGIRPPQGAETYSKFHRLRLVEHCHNLARKDIDCAITGYVQCRPDEVCEDMQLRYGWTPAVLESEILNYAYHILVDGNGALNRLARYLCSGSVPILSRVIEQWYHAGLRPWMEYLPLNLNFTNLEELVDWAQTHHDEAEEIGKRGMEFAENHLQLKDMQCYTFRQIVEYERLRVEKEKWPEGELGE